ncbi:hypothetical protein [Xylophilus ampelinus]|uniref:Uncharacterized protein n=1 Tax=Xylophilus ampelinus TaxID=54067 RepID=A0A318SU45_9BURK|nr:hypothetical protein [Xylophilus ampelinus]MCS4511866.1 hypothetical protein [Xylophilus ampelinus]PYE73330.1 hypothetical protein DFQ15_1392 [Xylophilus ampelinus]
MKPVRTREDCIGWLSLEDVEREAFASLVAAKAFSKRYDFLSDLDVPEGQDWPDSADGSIGWLTPEDVVADCIRIFSARMQVLAQSRGVAIQSMAGVGGELESLASLEKRYGDHIKGQVHTITEADIAAMPVAHRKALRAAIKTGKAVKTAIAGG